MTHYEMIIALFKLEGLTCYWVSFSDSEALRISKGKHKAPFVVANDGVLPDDSDRTGFLFTIYDAVKWIEARGLKRC